MAPNYGSFTFESRDKTIPTYLWEKRKHSILFVLIICSVAILLTQYEWNGWITNEFPPNRSPIRQIISAFDMKTQMMENTIVWNMHTSKLHSKTTNRIELNPHLTYQTIFGFGGAFTEASALQFQKLPSNVQEKVLEAYFGETGSRYTFGRVHMNSCDFCVQSYNFDNVTDDIELEHFDMTVDHDRRTMIPFIKRAMKKQPQLKLFVSPWSPPKWMKVSTGFANQTMDKTAEPIGLAPPYQYSWAKYFSKFITAYANYNITIWGITVQNEPEFNAPWEACMYTVEYMSSFILNHLGPTLRRDHPNVKIMVYDHNRPDVYRWATEMYSNSDVAKYIDGLAFHWYSNTNRELDGVEGHSFLNDTYHYRSDKFLLATESSNCPGVATDATEAWRRAERYAHDILTDLNNCATGWVDWNLMLDHTGGPNHLNNKCDAPILLNEDEQDIVIQPMYYYIAHFSKFVPPGSRRIDVSIKAQYQKPGGVELFNGFPGGAWNCEHSRRQQWEFTKDEKLRVQNSTFCMTNVDGQHVEMWGCWDTNTQRWRLQGDNLVNINDGKCLVAVSSSEPSKSNLLVEECDPTKQNQKWKQQGQGFVSSKHERCLTAGYPFLQSTAFLTPEGQQVLVVLNENTEPISFTISSESDTFDAEIRAKGLHTFLL